MAHRKQLRATLLLLIVAQGGKLNKGVQMKRQLWGLLVFLV